MFFFYTCVPPVLPTIVGQKWPFLVRPIGSDPLPWPQMGAMAAPCESCGAALCWPSMALLQRPTAHPSIVGKFVIVNQWNRSIRGRGKNWFPVDFPWNLFVEHPKHFLCVCKIPMVWYGVMMFDGFISQMCPLHILWVQADGRPADHFGAGRTAVGT